MGSNNMETLKVADPDTENEAAHFNALKSKLRSLYGKNLDVLENLTPSVRKRVDLLKELQSQHDDLEAKFFEERKALEDKYQLLYQPLYTKRYEVVFGVELEVGATGAEQPEEKGVPDFWLTAMKNNAILVEEISEHDEEALKFLKDIRWSRVDNPKGFKLEFLFDTNPFFNNPVLTKTYHMVDEYAPILENAIGTEIEWLPGKCLTQKILKKKPKKGSKNTKPITKIKKCESFFNFFSPPNVPEVDDIDEDAVEALPYLVEQDYEVGSTIRDKLIPHAVSWFTGEAAEVEFDDIEEEDEDDYGEEEEDDDDEEDEEDDDDDVEDEVVEDEDEDENKNS